MLHRAFVALFFVFSCLAVLAQNTGTISGKVTDSVQLPLEGTAVLLVAGAKDVPVKSALPDEKGAFVLEKIVFGTYKLVISMTGFSKESGVAVLLNEEKNNINVGTVKLVHLSANLQASVKQENIIELMY